jgi:hypothetical protein
MFVSGFKGPDAFWDQLTKMAETLRRSFPGTTMFALTNAAASGLRIEVADWQFEGGPKAIQYTDDTGPRVVIAVMEDVQQARWRVKAARSPVFPPEDLSDAELDAVLDHTSDLTFNDHPTRFEWWATSSGGLIGIGEVDGTHVVVESRGLALDELSYTLLTDIDPAIDGMMARIREARGGM